MKSGIYVGSIHKEGVETLTESITKILYAGAGDQVKIAALEVLGKGVQAPTHTSISNCSFDLTAKGEEIE